MVNNVGKFLKLERIKNNFTQVEMSKGICTPSYLSRIENNNVIANHEMYELLFNRLGIKYGQIQDTHIDVNNQLERWYKEMLEGENSNVNVYELEQLSKNTNVEFSLKFDIIYCRYLLDKKEMEQAGDMLDNLKIAVKQEHSRDFFLLTAVSMVYLYEEGEYGKAIKAGSDLMQMKDFATLANKYEISILQYNLALNHLRLNQYESSIRFAKDALDFFTHNYHFNLALDAQILLGIAYNDLGKWDESLHYYNLSEKVLGFLPEDKRDMYRGMIYNNTGHCYEVKGDSDQAITFYKMSLEHKRAPNDRMRTLINLISCNLESKNIKEAKGWLQVALDTKNSQTTQKYIYRLEIYFLLLHEEKPSIRDIDELKNASLNYFSEKSLWDLVYMHSLNFAGIYEQYHSYKKANELYKTSLTALKRLKGAQ